MLGSLSPLGQRARSARWGVTATAYTVGSVVGGTVVGGILGGIGEGVSVLAGSRYLTGAGLVALALGSLWGAAADGGMFGLKLPTVRRQVSQSWRDRYRGWVYAFGYGFVLSLGVVTITNAAAVYLTLMAEVATGSWAVGAALGGCAGALRAATVVATAPVRRADQSDRLSERLDAWARTSRRATTLIEGGIGTLLSVVIVVSVTGY